METLGEYAFDGCSSLKVVINYSALQFSKGSSDYGYIAFYADRVYNNVDGVVDGFVFSNASPAELLGYLNNDTELFLPDNYKGEPYVIGSEAFRGRGRLSSVTIPEGVTSIGSSAFSGCSSLSSIEIPNSVTSIGSYAFQGCSSLRSVLIPPSVSSVGQSAFKNCSSLKKARYPNTLGKIFGDSGASFYYITYTPENFYVSDGWLWSKNNEVLGFVPIDFAGDEEHKYIVPENVKRVSHNCFAYCDSLETVIFPKSIELLGTRVFNNSNIKYLMCEGNVPEIQDNTFYNCRFKKIFIPETYFENYASNEYWPIDVSCCWTPVYDCEVDGLYYQIVSAPELTCRLVTGNPFDRHDEENIEVPSTVTYRDRNFTVVSVGAGALLNYKKLNHVTIPSTVNTIGECALYFVPGLKSITINPSTTPLSVAGDQCRSNSVETLAIGRNVDHLEYLINRNTLRDVILDGEFTTVAESTFANCSNIVNITLGEKVETIGDNAFSGLTSLKTIISKNLTPPSMTESVGFSNDNYFDATVYVPGDALAVYKAADVWKGFWNFEALEENGIDTVMDNASADADASADVYNLQGVCVMRSATADRISNLPAGLYIINGKKVMVK